MGVFLNLMEWAKEQKQGKPLSLLDRCVISITAGGIGAVVGNPADLCLIRMQADKTLPVEQRRNYTHVGNAMARVVKEEGFFALWKGANPTVVRAMVLNLGMLAPYDYCKGIFSKSLGIKDQNAVNLLSSAVSGFLASFMSLPFDYMKTKLQKQKAGPDGKLPYSGIFNAFSKTLAKEGVSGLWTGFPTYYVRIAPHAMLTLLFTDYLKKFI